MNRFLNSAALFVLPSVDAILGAISRLLHLLDRQVQALDARLEQETVELARHNERRRAAIMAAEQVYVKRAGDTLDVIHGLAGRREQAAKARNRVRELLDD